MNIADKRQYLCNQLDADFDDANEYANNYMFETALSKLDDIKTIIEKLQMLEESEEWAQYCKQADYEEARLARALGK